MPLNGPRVGEKRPPPAGFYRVSVLTRPRKRIRLVAGGATGGRRAVRHAALGRSRGYYTIDAAGFTATRRPAGLTAGGAEPADRSEGFFPSIRTGTSPGRG